MTAREEGNNLVGGCKEEGASASLLLFPYLDLAARNPRVSCSWGMENGWRKREKRERDLGERVVYYLA